MQEHISKNYLCKSIIKYILAVAIFLFLILVIYIHISPTVSPSLGTTRLNIETYLAGNNQPTHPSVYTFDTSWNGYKYWMAYSPYPNGNGEEENPCIAVSNDLYYWETPGTLANPIADNEETGCDELKDPHILYRKDLDRIEVWYLGRLSQRLGGSEDDHLLLLRKYSFDGVTWSDYEIMTEIDYLSPSIIWDREKYQMWAIGYDLYGTSGTISYQESKDGYNWTNKTLCSINGENTGISIWHGSVTEYNGTYYMCFIDNKGKQKIFCCTSYDGIQFYNAQSIIENNNFWRNLYRPFLWYDGNQYICIYGVVNAANEWYITMSKGTSLDCLIGINHADLSKMYPLTDSTTNTHSMMYYLKAMYHAVRNYLRIELMLLALIEIILMRIRPKLYTSNKYFFICQILNIFISVYWIVIKMQLSKIFNLIAAIFAILIINISMSALLSWAKLCHSR